MTSLEIKDVLNKNEMYLINYLYPDNTENIKIFSVTPDEQHAHLNSHTSYVIDRSTTVVLLNSHEVSSCVTHFTLLHEIVHAFDTNRFHLIKYGRSIISVGIDLLALFLVCAHPYMLTMFLCIVCFKLFQKSKNSGEIHADAHAFAILVSTVENKESLQQDLTSIADFHRSTNRKRYAHLQAMKKFLDRFLRDGYSFSKFYGTYGSIEFVHGFYYTAILNWLPIIIFLYFSDTVVPTTPSILIFAGVTMVAVGLMVNQLTNSLLRRRERVLYEMYLNHPEFSCNINIEAMSKLAVPKDTH